MAILAKIQNHFRVDPRQRKALELFRNSDTITSHDVGLLLIVDPAKNSRKYLLGADFTSIIR